MAVHSSFDQAFGQVLRESRLRGGLSQEELEFRSGVHRTYISEIERAVKCPSLRVVVALSKALGQRPHTLLDAAEQMLGEDYWSTGPSDKGTERTKSRCQTGSQ